MKSQTYFFLSYCPLFKIRFPDFSRLCFHISEWKLVASFHMKSYRSSLTFVTVDLLFHELLSSVQNSFSRLFLAMLLHIWMKIGNKLPYEELQIKFDFPHGWPTFSWVIALCLKLFSGLFSAMLSQISMTVGSKLPYQELQIKFNFRHGWPTFSWVIALCSKFFSGLSLAMFSHTWMKVGRKPQYEEFQIKFDFYHSWSTVSWLIAIS